MRFTIPAVLLLLVSGNRVVLFAQSGVRDEIEQGYSFAEEPVFNRRGRFWPERTGIPGSRGSLRPLLASERL